MKCKKCGKETPDNIPNCIYCGYIFSEEKLKKPNINVNKNANYSKNVPQQNKSKSYSYNKATPAPANKNNNNNVLIAVLIPIIIIIIITLIAIVLLFVRSNLQSDFSSDIFSSNSDSIIAEKLDEIDESKSFEEQVAQIEDILYKLADDDIIKKDTIQYEEEYEIFSFETAEGELSGVSLSEFDDNTNMRSSETSEVTEDEYNSNLYNVNSEDLTAIILNGFENNSYRRDFYEELKEQWDAKGLSTSIDTSVTVQEMKKLKAFDVIIFAMHGSMYKNKPVLCLNQIATNKNNAYLVDDLNSKYIAKVYYEKTDKKYHYWILPAFFENNYNDNELESKIIFSESCDFFGDDSKSKTPDNTMANTLAKISSGAVIGYHNSVGADYSRNVMEETINCAISGNTAEKSLKKAKNKYGDNDGLVNIFRKKYKAYPIIKGNKKSYIAKEKHDQIVKVLSNGEWFAMGNSAGEMLSTYYFNENGTAYEEYCEEYTIYSADDQLIRTNFKYKIEGNIVTCYTSDFSFKLIFSGSENLLLYINEDNNYITPFINAKNTGNTLLNKIKNKSYNNCDILSANDINNLSIGNNIDDCELNLSYSTNYSSKNDICYNLTDSLAYFFYHINDENDELTNTGLVVIEDIGSDDEFKVYLFEEKANNITDYNSNSYSDIITVKDNL